jgi:hypothetical protein
MTSWMMSNKSYKERDAEEKFGKKRYIKRKIEEREADCEIQEYEFDDTDEVIEDEFGTTKI